MRWCGVYRWGALSAEEDEEKEEEDEEEEGKGRKEERLIVPWAPSANHVQQHRC